jgi:hypothetical protein
MISFNVTKYSDSTGKFSTLPPQLLTLMNRALEVLSSHVVGASGTAIDISVSVVKDGALGYGEAAAQATYSGSFTYSPNYIQLPKNIVNAFQHKFTTGVSARNPQRLDPNTMLGNVGDAEGSLFVTESELSRVINAINAASGPLPESNVEVVGMLHEILHIAGFDGWRDLKTGAPVAIDGITEYGLPRYDQCIQINGTKAYFVGAAAVAIYGDIVPLRPMDGPFHPIYHVEVLNTPANWSQPYEYQGQFADLMNGAVSEGMTISDLDVAMLLDLGYRNQKTLTSRDGHTFIPGAGPITINATAGTSDRAYFVDKLSDHRLAHDGKVVIVSSKLVAQNVATLNSVETLKFADGMINAHLVGTNGSDSLLGNAGSDVFYGAGGNDVINGGGGIDVAAYSGSASNYLISKTSDGFSVSDKSGVEGGDELRGVERLWFRDYYVALDIEGPTSAGAMYRLYQAAFDRKPDLGGLGFWINATDNGVSLASIAGGFMQSAEFKTLYGTNPTTEEILTRFYQNVLHRQPEQAGYDFWLGILKSGAARPDEVLVAFAESPENQAQVIGSISNGIEFFKFG